MLFVKIRQFAADESGGGTIMGLFRFILLVGICGLAVDTTDGFRNRTKLQSTADASALAAVRVVSWRCNNDNCERPW